MRFSCRTLMEEILLWQIALNVAAFTCTHKASVHLVGIPQNTNANGVVFLIFCHFDLRHTYKRITRREFSFIYLLGGCLMTMPRILILAAPVLILGCSVLPNPTAQELTPDLKEMRTGGISFVYSTRDFAEVKIEKVKKETVLGSEDGPADGESPEHYCFELKDKRPLPAFEQGPRYFFPTYSFICAFPLKDASVEDFSKAYSGLDLVAGKLHELLREHPGNPEHWSETEYVEIPDFPFEDAGHSIISKFQYLAFRSGSGVLFITQYTNEMQPNPANNEELTLTFQGLTNDGEYYVAARIAITHPSLPRGIDFTDHIVRDIPDYNYLKKDEKELEGFSEDSFRPSLKSLKAMLASIQVD